MDKETPRANENHKVKYKHKSGNPAVRAEAVKEDRARKTKAAKKKVFMQTTVTVMIAALLLSGLATGIISSLN